MYRKIKPFIDPPLALILLLVVSPLLLVISLVILVTDGRPVFFRQERVGLSGGTFRILKFRTMRDGPSLDGLPHKWRDVHRITKVGHFLRDTSLDELPQLWNVVCGDMSLIGPRPEIPSRVDRTWEERHTVKPGMTGLWQVTKRNQFSSIDTSVDLEYIDDLTAMADLKIAAKTIGVLIRRS